MSVIVLLIVAGGAVAGGFLAAFVWAVGAGQYDDTATPPLRILFDDRVDRRPESLSRGVPDVESRS